jgi:hypothetical protein
MCGRRGTGRKSRNNWELDAIYDYMFFVCCVIVPTKLMRFPRVKADGQGFYHCVSRVVEGRFIFQTSGHGSVEAERFTEYCNLFRELRFEVSGPV